MAPMTSRTVTFWWKRMADGAIMRIGVRAKRVCAMPAEVYRVANSEALTPMNGPKMGMIFVTAITTEIRG